MWKTATPRPRRCRPALALAVLGLVLVTLTSGLPASATTPPGAQVELFFAQDPDYTTQVQSGTFNSTLFAVPVGGVYTPRVNNCPKGTRVAFAFAPASVDPGTAGSPERPLVTAGATVEDLFAWPAPDSPGTAMAYQMNPRNLVGPASDLVSIDTRWPAGALVSLVSVCYSGKSLVPAQEPVVADASGYAITSWLQFTTVASTSNPAATSAGFRVGIKTDPVVTLTGIQSGGTEAMTAWVTDPLGAPLLAATGTIDFHSGTGTQRTLVGSVPLGPAATAPLTVPVPPPGTQTIYDATYVPDATASTTYNSVTSPRHAVIGSPVVLAADVAVSVRPTTVGTPATAVVTVSRQGAAASGSVGLLVDGQPWRSGPLLGGRAVVPLAATLRAGSHDVEADYSGDASTLPGQATTTATVSRLTGSVRAVGLVTRSRGQRPSVSLKVKVRAHGAPRPTGTVVVRRDHHVLARGRLRHAAAVLVLAHPGRVRHGRLELTISYSGDAAFLPLTLTRSVRLRAAHPAGAGHSTGATT